MENNQRQDKVNLKKLLIDTIDEMNHLEKAKQLLEDVYFEADHTQGKLSYKTLRKIYEYLGFDKGEDE